MIKIEFCVLRDSDNVFENCICDIALGIKLLQGVKPKLSLTMHIKSAKTKY